MKRVSVHAPPDDAVPTDALIVGAGQFAVEVAEVACDSGFSILGYVEGVDRSRATAATDPPIVWVDDLPTVEPQACLIVGIGAVARRDLLEKLVSSGRQLATVIHPSAHIGASAILEPGCVVFPHVVIGAATTIGSGTIINRGALIGHHTSIGEHSFIGPGANVAGSVTIGSQAMIGMGAIIRDHLTVGARAVVGAGAVVVKDVVDADTVIGNPATSRSQSHV